MKIGIENTLVDITCPKCSSDFGIQLGEIKKENRVCCPYCNSNIDLIDEKGSTRKGVDEINAAMARLEKVLNEFG